MNLVLSGLFVLLLAWVLNRYGRWLERRWPLFRQRRAAHRWTYRVDVLLLLVVAVGCIVVGVGSAVANAL